MVKRLRFFLYSLVAFSAQPIVVLAAPAATKSESVVNSTLRDKITGATQLGTASPQQTVVTVINVALGFLALIAVLLILYAGFTWMTSAGNEDKVSTAKKVLISSVIGLLVILAAWGLSIYFIGVSGYATGTTIT